MGAIYWILYFIQMVMSKAMVTMLMVAVGVVAIVAAVMLTRKTPVQEVPVVSPESMTLENEATVESSEDLQMEDLDEDLQQIDQDFGQLDDELKALD